MPAPDLPLPVERLGTVLAVWAHPDDESYLAAGLMSSATGLGQRVVCVTATHGQLGGPPGADVRTTARRRAGELARALVALGVREQRWLGYHDGHCHRVPEREGAARVRALIEETRADTVVTFGPDGLTGHDDHRAVSRWATAAARSARRPVRLLYATVTPEFLAEHADVHDRFDVFLPGSPRPSRTDALAVDLHLEGAALRRKLAALGAHESQTAGILQALGEQRYAAWWRHERFVLAEDWEAAAAAPVAVAAPGAAA